VQTSQAILRGFFNFYKKLLKIVLIYCYHINNENHSH
jgi:hypothetical protein